MSVDKAPHRISIRIVVLILPSDTLYLVMTLNSFPLTIQKNGNGYPWWKYTWKYPCIIAWHGDRLKTFLASQNKEDWNAIFRRLGFLLASLLLISLGSPAHGQGGFGNFIQNLFRPIMRQIDTKLPLIFKSCDIFWVHVSCYLLICRPLNNFLRPINFGLRDIFRFGPQTNAAFRWLKIELKK